MKNIFFLQNTNNFFLGMHFSKWFSKSINYILKEFALEVKKYLCLDVENIEKDFFIHNGFNLLNEKFNPTNLNTYGTKLMDKLFSLNEMIEGTIEPQKNNSRALDQTRVDKIKSIFFKTYLIKW